MINTAYTSSQSDEGLSDDYPLTHLVQGDYPLSHMEQGDMALSHIKQGGYPLPNMKYGDYSLPHIALSNMEQDDHLQHWVCCNGAMNYQGYRITHFMSTDRQDLGHVWIRPERQGLQLPRSQQSPQLSESSQLQSPTSPPDPYAPRICHRSYSEPSSFIPAPPPPASSPPTASDECLSCQEEDNTEAIQLYREAGTQTDIQLGPGISYFTTAKLMVGVVLCAVGVVTVIFFMKCKFKIGFQMNVCHYI